MSSRILLCGASGFIGRHLYKLLLEKEYKVDTVSRFANNGTYTWKCLENRLLEEDYHTVINLSGAKILSNWDTVKKSRISSGNIINQWISSLKCKPNLYLAASGVGIYPCDRKINFSESDAIVSPTEVPSELSEMQRFVREWELSVRFPNGLLTETKRISMRLGVVLGKESDFINSFFPLIKVGLVFDIGDKKRLVPWVHINDVVNSIVYTMENKNLFDEVDCLNIVSPYASQTTYEDIVKAFIKAADKQQLIYGSSVNDFISKLGGTMAYYILDKPRNDLLFSSMKVYPKILVDKGFIFKFGSIDKSANNILKFYPEKNI